MAKKKKRDELVFLENSLLTLSPLTHPPSHAEIRQTHAGTLFHRLTKDDSILCRKAGLARGWAKIRKDSIELIISEPNAHLPFEQAHFTGSFYFYTAHVDALWEQLKDAARVCYSIENFDDGMRAFAIYDNNGYLLQFGKYIAEELV